MIESNLRQRLDVLRGTLKKAIVLNGAGRLAIALVGCFFLGLFLDYYFFRWGSINTVFRAVTLLGLLGAVGYIAFKYIFSPLSVPLNTDDMALAVEKEFPKLNDSLISSVQLTRMMANDGSVSTPMVEEIARQAHAAASELDFSRVVKFERIKPVLLGAAGAIAFFLLLLGLPATRPYVQTGLVRIFNPFSKTSYPVRTQIAIKGGQHEVIAPKNEAHRIVAEVSGDLPKTAFIQFDYLNGKGYGSKEPITSVRPYYDLASGTNKMEFEFEYNPVLSSFNYVVIAGDNQTDPHSVRAVERPRLDNLDVVYELPAYITDKKSEPRRDTVIRGVVGTRAYLSCEFNKPLAEAQIKLGDGPPRNMTPSTNHMIYTVGVDLESSRDYEIFLKDQDGLDNSKNKIRHKILVLPDNPPRVAWRKPAADLEVAPAATVALDLFSDDDFGLEKTLIKYKKYHTVVPPAPVGGQNAPQPVIDQSTPAIEGSFDLVPAKGDYGRNVQKLDFNQDWALAELALQPGDLIEYWAESYDWCPAKRKMPEPQIYRLKILSIEDLHRKLDVERMRLVDDLVVIIRLEESDKKQVGAIAEHLNFGNAFDNTQRARVSEASSLQEEARRKTAALQKAFEALIARYKSNGLDTPDELERLHMAADQLGIEQTVKMPDASKQITASALLRDDKTRVDQLKSAAVKQDEILEDLNRLLAMMQKWAETEELLRMSRELLAKQRSVTAETATYKERLGAKLPSEANKDELSQVKGLEHKERDCASDMKQLFVRMTQALAKMLDLDKFAAKNIDDSIKIAQNTDVTLDNLNLSTTGDTTPSIEDKMNAAQTDIARFSFGTAGGRQRASESALTRIITVLSRRHEIDKKLMADIEHAIKDAQRNLEEQRKLTQQNKGLMDKADLVRSIAEAKAKLTDLRAREAKLRNETGKASNEPNADASKLEAALNDAREGIQKLIDEQDKIFQDTVLALSAPEREMAGALSELAELEIKERALAAGSALIAKEAPEKAAGNDLKKYELAMNTNANDQADRRNELDAIGAKMAALMRAASVAKADAAVTLAGKAAEKALPSVEGASLDMGNAADVIRRGSPTAEKSAAARCSELQIAAADKIAKARAALTEAAVASTKDRKDAFGKTAGKQGETQGKAGDLKSKLEKLSADIDKAHATAANGLEKPSKADASGAAGKIGEAAAEMGASKDELNKPNPAAATRNIAKSLDALEDAKRRLGEMRKKVDELKDPPRQLERVQGDIKNETRKLADEIKNFENQLPSDGSNKEKAEDNMKKASNHMQNAQNALGGSKGSEGKSGASKSGKDSKDGSDSKSGKPGDDQKGGANKDDAGKEEDKALSELDKALAKLDALAEKANREGENHKTDALNRLKEQQIAAREEVQKLQSKLNELKDKSGNEKAGKASKANESAAKNQSQASGQMGKGNQSGSESSQEEAEQDLQAVLDNLDQLQQDVQNQNRKEKLFQIEQELKKMLDAQKSVQTRTGEADKVSVPRAKKGMVKKIFEEQQELANSVRVVVKKLEEAPVFQWVLQTSVDDMMEAAARLDKEDSGAGTQEIQDDAGKKIADLIEALRKERTKPNPGGGGGGGGGGGKQPLVPPVAQLKMLRIMQKDVNTKIKRIDEEVTKTGAADMNKDQKDRQRRSAAKEGDIVRMMLKITKESQGNSPKLEAAPPEPDDGK